MKRSTLIALVLALVTLSLPAIATTTTTSPTPPAALAHEFAPPTLPYLQLAQTPFIPIAVTAKGKTTFPLWIEIQRPDCDSPSPSEVACTIVRDRIEVHTTVFHNIATAESWRPLVAAYFPPDQVDTAIRVMDCESRGDPYAQNSRSSAGGLFQFLDSTWRSTGFGDYSKYDPEANIAAAASWLALKDYSSSWWASQWECY